MRNLINCVLIAAAAGGVSHAIIHMFWDLPFPVEGCIAGTVGYLTVWGVELWNSRPPAFKMDWWGR